MKDVVVYLYEADFEYLKENEEVLLSKLPKWRREKTEKITALEARLRSLAAGLLLHMVLGEKAEKVYIGEYGKPDSVSDGVYFNLSHSEGLIGLAVSKQCVGLDVECKSDDSLRIARRMFAEEEWQLIQECQEKKGEEDARRLFQKLWTRKEAYLKCRGIGISVPLRSFLVIDDRTTDRTTESEYFVLDETAEIRSLEEEEDPASTGYFVKTINYPMRNGRTGSVSTVLKKVDFSLDIVTVQSI